MAALRPMVMGMKVTAREAKEMNIVNSLYTDSRDLNLQCEQFVKRFSPATANRAVLKRIKSDIHRTSITACTNEMVGPVDWEICCNPIILPGGKTVSIPGGKL